MTAGRVMGNRKIKTNQQDSPRGGGAARDLPGHIAEFQA